MKTNGLKALTCVAVFLGSTFAVASGVPEFFGQPEDGKARAEASFSYKNLDHEGELTTTTLEGNSMTFGGWFDYGVTHSLALRLGMSYRLLSADVNNALLTGGADVAIEDLPGASGIDSVYRTFDLDLVGHHDMGGMLLHYGLESDITPNKNTLPDYAAGHAFTPYLGVSMGGDSMKYGARADFRSIVSDNDPFGADAYSLGAFGEMHASAMILGASVTYFKNGSRSAILDLVSANVDEDAVQLKLYGVFNISESLHLTPFLKFNYELEGFEDQMGGEAYIAARYNF